MFFSTKDGEALYSQQKQDLELIVAQIMSSFLQNTVPYCKKKKNSIKMKKEKFRSFRNDLNQIPTD